MLFPFAELAERTGGTWLVQPSGDGGVAAISTDSRQLRGDQAFLALHGETFDGHNFVESAAETAAMLIVDQAISVDRPPVLQVEDTLKAYQALATAHRTRFPDLFVVGITGSCGKTSSKEIISSVLAAEFGDPAVLRTVGNTNNQIGVPQNLLRLTTSHRAAVLEMGTNQPGEIEILTRMVQPNVAVITNVGPVHLEGLIDLDGVAREKSSIFRGLAATGLAVLGDELATNPLVQGALPSRVTTVGFRGDADIRIDYGGSDLVQARFTVEANSGRQLDVTWPLRGRHMAINAAAAVAVADELDLSDQTILDGLLGCRLPGMRMEVTEAGGVTWINDAYNANPESMRALIQWLADAPPPAGKLVLVLGDMLELGTQADSLHAEILAYARAMLPTSCIVAFGPMMHAAAAGTAPAFTDFNELQSTIAELLAAGDRIALKGSRGMALERLLPTAE